MGVFDLLAPDADPLSDPLYRRLPDGGRSPLGRNGRQRLCCVRPPIGNAGARLSRGGNQCPEPLDLSAAGDAVLVRAGGADGELRMVDMAGVERVVLPDEALLGPIGVERLFGPDGAQLRTGPCDDAASPSSDLCVLDASGAGTGYDVPGQLIDVAWDPGERIPVWVSTTGVGIIRDGTVTTIVRLGDWQPVRIAGFWSNVVILASGSESASRIRSDGAGRHDEAARAARLDRRPARRRPVAGGPWGRRSRVAIRRAMRAERQPGPQSCSRSP